MTDRSIYHPDPYDHIRDALDECLDWGEEDVVNVIDGEHEAQRRAKRRNGR